MWRESCGVAGRNYIMENEESIVGALARSGGREF
jgi:hypothetical protein